MPSLFPSFIPPRQNFLHSHGLSFGSHRFDICHRIRNLTLPFGLLRNEGSDWLTVTRNHNRFSALDLVE